MNQKVRGVVLVVFSAVIFGMAPLLTKEVFAAGGTPTELVALRPLLVLPVLWILAKRSEDNIWLSKKQLIPVFLLSSSFLVTAVLLTNSYLYIPSGMATTLHFVYPVFVVVGSILFLREKPSPVKIICIVLCLAGILCFYTPGGAANLTGIAMAFLSGITYAFYIIYLSRSGLQKLKPFVLCFWTTLFSAALGMGFLLATDSLHTAMTPKGWILAFFTAVLTAAVAVVAFQEGVKRVGPQQAAILSTFEPITSIVVGIIVYGDPFGVKTVAGSGSILTAVILLTLFDRETD